MQFIDELRIFHEQMISEWYEHSGNLIGLSIQVLDDLQDEDSITRTTLNTHADEYLKKNQTLINHYCFNIIQQDGHFINCNKLDFYLKQYLQKHTDYTKVICQCHGGVTNILLKWKLPNSDINWYIFIGQFLLKKIKSEGLKKYFFDTAGVIELNKTSLEKQFRNVGNLVNEGGFVDKDYQTKLMENIAEKGKDTISLVSVQEYTFFESYILKAFEDFISKYMTKSNGTLVPNAILKEYIDHIDPENLKFHFDECLKIRLQENVIETKNLIDQISEKILLLNGKIPLKNLKDLKELALSYTNGGVGTTKFIGNGKKILAEISNLK